MSQLKIKLTDIFTPKDIRYKQRAPIHILSNSIRRNTILNCNSHNNKSLTYDCKLPQLRMTRPEIAHMLRYLLAKQEMTLPDRNLVRRIMLDVFDEDLLEAGSKDFIRHINMLEGQQGQILVPSSREFYMVLKGKTAVTTGQIDYEKSEGETFGQLQLLSGGQINQIMFLKNSLVITLRQQQFQKYFYSKFNQKYLQLQRQLDCIQQFLNKIPIMSKYMLLARIERRLYRLGQKIVLKGQSLDYIIIVADKLKEEQLRYVVKGCIGLYQLKKDKHTYEETVYSPKNQLELFFIKISDFERYVICQNSQSLMNSSHLFLDKSFVKTTLQSQNPQGNPKIINFMRMRKVKMISQKRSKTEPHSILDNQFRFLRFDCIGLDFNLSKYDSKGKTRYKPKNSFSVTRNKRDDFK